MGTVTKTIGSGGGRDYSTPQAWADALPADLVSDGNSQAGNFYADSEFVFSSNFGAILTLSGHTTDATHTIIFQAAPGQSHIDNASVPSNAFRYNPANGAALKVSGSYSRAITGSDTVFVKRLQLANFGAGNNNEIFSNVLSGGTLHLSQLIVESSTSSARGSSLSNGDATNCIFIQRSNIHGVYSEYHNFAFVNCGFASPSDVGNTQSAIHVAGGAAPSLVNCYIFGFASVCDGSATGHHNGTDLSSGGFGSGNVTSLTYGDQFENVLDGTHDFRLKSGSGLIDSGQAVGTDGVPVVDAVDTTRPQGSAPDIGPWEFVSASGIALSGNLSEAGDAANAAVKALLAAAASDTEAGDAFAGAVSGAPSAVMELAEAGDAASGAASLRLLASAPLAEGADAVAIAGAIALSARSAAQERGDLWTAAGDAPLAGASVLAEAGDLAAAHAIHAATVIVDPYFLVAARARMRAVLAPSRARTFRPRRRA